MPIAITNPQEAAQTLKQLFEEAHGKATFFGGAGVSTASGIPDFRSVDGLYHQKFAYPPEVMLSHSFYVSHTEEFYEFYRNKMIALDAKPNRAHTKLAELERDGQLLSVVTQNIDGLHQLAGSQRVHELHGSVHRNICQRCGHVHSAEWVLDQAGVPVCEACAGPVKPDVVLYEEALDSQVMDAAIRDIAASKLLVIGGTSLVVYPAAGLIRYFGGDNVVIVNRDPTPQDSMADYVISCDIAQAFDF